VARYEFIQLLICRNGGNSTIKIAVPAISESQALVRNHLLHARYFNSSETSSSSFSNHIRQFGSVAELVEKVKRRQDPAS
jgi:hypothetical protein